MNIKNATLSFFLLVSIPLFSQTVAQNKGVVISQTNVSYLDSIKKTFIKDNMAACVDSLWMKELTSLDIYNDLSADIKNTNTDQKVDFELPTELLRSRLAQMDAKSPFNIEYNQGLENIIKSFLKNRKKSFERLMAISEYYFPLFEEALDKKNVPLEIKYLAVVESALNPKAVSKMGATGLWQFMYHTGKQYNLKIDSYVDERSDPLLASDAAAQYMANMYTIFGDWDLVLASYNSGPGNVSKAIRRSGGQQNFWNIKKHLPKETQGYVPAFLATMYIYEYHKEHGIAPERALVKHFATDTIMLKRQMSFKQISDLIDIPVAQLQLLNPSYKLNVIPVYGEKSHYLRLPQDKVAVFTSNEDKIYAYTDHLLNLREKPFRYTARAIVAKDTTNSAESSSDGKTKLYRVKKGDNLGSIARKYDVAVLDIKKWNNIRGNAVPFGKSLKIMVNESLAQTSKKETKELKAISKTIAVTENKAIVATSNKEVKSIKTDSVTDESSSVYIVQKGDNLENIAKKFNVTVQEIRDWNKLPNISVILGSTLQLTHNTTVSKETIGATPELKDIEYTVEKGDNLGNIAKKFGATVADLKLWNKLQSINIGLGNKLIVAKNEVVIATSNPVVTSFKKKDKLSKLSSKETSDYLVKKGDSLFSISKKYPGVTISDLKKWNDIRGEELKPGMKLKING
jgi:membrane-bound lytic murein transglycosylase D